MALQQCGSARGDLEDMRRGQQQLQPHHPHTPHIIWPCALHHCLAAPIPTHAKTMLSIIRVRMIHDMCYHTCTDVTVSICWSCLWYICSAVHDELGMCLTCLVRRHYVAS